MVFLRIRKRLKIETSRPEYSGLAMRSQNSALSLNMLKKFPLFALTK